MKFIEDLHKAYLFNDFSKDELYDILEYSVYSVREYEHAETLKNEGDDVNSLGIILKGEVIVKKNLISGKSILIAQLGQGQTIGGAVIFSDRHTYPTTLQSKGRCVIFFLSKGSMQKLFSVNTKFLTKYIGSLSERIIMLNEIIESLSYSSIREKVAYFLLSEYKKTGNTLFSVPYTRIGLAEKLNVPRPSLSRTLSSLRKEGLIDFHKNTFKILDLPSVTDIIR